MVDLSLLPGSLAATAKPEIARKIPLSIGRTSVDRASFHMQRLYWTNLEVRYRCIDEALLQTEEQMVAIREADRDQVSGKTCRVS